MDKQRLIETLQQLHTELASAERIDPETLTLLETITEDVDRIAKRGGEMPDDGDERVSGRLRDLVERFEADHPQVSFAIGKLADALASIGI